MKTPSEKSPILEVYYDTDRVIRIRMKDEQQESFDFDVFDSISLNVFRRSNQLDPDYVYQPTFDGDDMLFEVSREDAVEQINHVLFYELEFTTAGTRSVWISNRYFSRNVPDKALIQDVEITLSDELIVLDVEGAVNTAQAVEAAERAKERVEGLTVNSVSGLRSKEGSFDGQVVELLGYSQAGDGGGGTVFWDLDSQEDDNGGTIFQVDGVPAGRWIRRRQSLTYLSDFGVLEGIADCKELIEKAHEHAYQKNHKEIVYPKAVINSTSGMVVKLRDGVKIHSDGCIINDVSDYNNGLLLTYRKEHDNELITTISSSSTEGSISLELTSTSGLEDDMAIVVNYDSREHDEMGEVNLIDYIDGNTVYLNTPTRADYPSGEDVRCFVPGKNISVNGLTIKTNGKSHTGLYCYDFINSDFNGVYIDDDIYGRFSEGGVNSFSNGFRLNTTYACSINDFKATKSRYGLFAIQNSFLQVNRSRGYNSWHTFENAGWNWDVEYNDCYTVNDSFGFRSHEGGRLIFNSCNTYGGKGFYIQGWHAEFKNCRILRANATQAILQREEGEKVFRTELIKTLKIDGFVLDAYGGTPDNRIWRNTTTTSFGNDIYDCEITIKNVEINLREGQTIALENFGTLKGGDMTFNIIEYHNTTSLDAISISDSTGGSILDLNGVHLKNYHQRALLARFTEDNSVQSWKGVKITGHAVDETTTSYIWSTQSNTVSRVDFEDVTIDLGDEIFTSIFQIHTDKEVYISNAKTVKGCASRMFFIRGDSKIYATNCYTLNNKIPIHIADNSEKMHMNNIHRNTRGIVEDGEYDQGVGPVIKSPNGTSHRLTVDDTGTVSGGAI